MTAKMLHEICLLPTGKIRAIKTGEAAPGNWVYQRTHPDYGNLGRRGKYGLQIRQRVIPADPKTALQLQKRNKFKLAVIEWQALNDEQKAAWNRAARSAQRGGYHHFLGWYLKQSG